jgi:uncharacterized protein YkwD
MGVGFFLSQPAGQPALTQLSKWTQIAQKTAQAQIAVAQRRVQNAAAPEPTGPELSRYEKLLCDLANAERRKHGLSPLKITPALAEVARGHSREMAAKGYFSHTSPTKGRNSVKDRYLLKFKQPPRLVAENIYMFKSSGYYRLTEKDFRRAHEGWMKSPGHRANILRKDPVNPTQIGVGIFVKNGSFWATQNFATPF